MKIYSTSLIFTLLSTISISQNLVRNPGFDSLNYCPSDYNQVDAALFWAQAQNNLNPSYGSDYMNSCTNGAFTVPAGTWGYQNAHSSNGYMATVTMAPSVATNYRENIYGQLSSPLVIGGTYEVSFYISHTDNSKYSSNNLGVKFATVPSFPINNISHVHSSVINTDNNNWTQISGTFIADSAYTYIALGNFYTDANTSTTTSCPSCPFVLYG